MNAPAVARYCAWLVFRRWVYGHRLSDSIVATVHGAEHAAAVMHSSAAARTKPGQQHKCCRRLQLLVRTWGRGTGLQASPAVNAAANAVVAPCVLLPLGMRCVRQRVLLLCLLVLLCWHAAGRNSAARPTRRHAAQARRSVLRLCCAHAGCTPMHPHAAWLHMHIAMMGMWGQAGWQAGRCCC